MLVLVLVLAGCGGKHTTAAPPPPATTARTTTAPAAPTLTSAEDRVSCAVLVTKLRAVSQLVSGSVELMTQSLHPKELARLTG
jgi:hypothetical protein